MCCRRSKYDLISCRRGECDRHIRHTFGIAACCIVVLVSGGIGQRLFVAVIAECDLHPFRQFFRFGQLQLTRHRHCHRTASQLRHFFSFGRVIYPNGRRCPQFIRHTAQLKLIHCTRAGVTFCAEGGSLRQIEAILHRAAAAHGRSIFAVCIVVIAAAYRAAVLPHQTAGAAGHLGGRHTILHRAGLQCTHNPTCAAVNGHILYDAIYHAKQVTIQARNGIVGTTVSAVECPPKRVCLCADRFPIADLVQINVFIEVDCFPSEINSFVNQYSKQPEYFFRRSCFLLSVLRINRSLDCKPISLIIPSPFQSAGCEFSIGSVVQRHRFAAFVRLIRHGYLRQRLFTIGFFRVICDIIGIIIFTDQFHLGILRHKISVHAGCAAVVELHLSV